MHRPGWLKGRGMTLLGGSWDVGGVQQGLQKGEEDSGEKDFEAFTRPDRRLDSIAGRGRASASS